MPPSKISRFHFHIEYDFSRCLEVVAFQNWNKKISFLFANNHIHHTPTEDANRQGAIFFQRKKNGAKKKSNFAIFFGGHEPLYCNFYSSVLNGHCRKSVDDIFLQKKIQNDLVIQKSKNPLWFTARLTLQQFSWSKYPKWAVEAAESVSTSGWGIDIHEVNTENRDIYGSLFPTMKTWLSFYTSHIVVFRILWTHRKYDVCFPKWCNCDWTQTPMRSSSYLLSSDLSHSTWVCECLKISWPRNPHNRLLLPAILIMIDSEH